MEHKREAGYTSVQLAPELMDCLAILPMAKRPLLVRQDAQTIVLNSTAPTLTPALDEVNCAICLENITTRFIDGEELGEAVFTPCTHSFHHKCITTALATDPRCPICRATNISRERIKPTSIFANLESAIRNNPFIKLPNREQQPVTDFEKDFAALPTLLKNQLQTLQQDLQKILETSFATPLAAGPEAAAAEADREPVTLATTPTETVAVETAEETREQQREHFAAAALAQLKLQKPE